VVGWEHEENPARQDEAQAAKHSALLICFFKSRMLAHVASVYEYETQRKIVFDKSEVPFPTHRFPQRGKLSVKYEYHEEK